jgi:multidrug efflux pump subunit AcrA (membrane-fusion protein)
MQNNKLFRKAALERLSSPEKLDELMQITNPRSWLVLLGIGLLLGGVVIWGIVGRIPTTVSGQGILTFVSDTVLPVQSLDRGTVEDVFVTPGESIQQGDVIARLTKTNGDPADVISPYAGRVLSLETPIGTEVDASQNIAYVERFDETDQKPEAIIYIPITQAIQITPGMEVQISPLNVQQSQFGFIQGRVKSVGENIASNDDLRRILNRDEIVQAIASQGLVVEIHIELIASDDFASGVLWSSNTAQELQLQEGTPCSASITIKQEPPINRVLPIFGSALLLTN